MKSILKKLNVLFQPEILILNLPKEFEINFDKLRNIEIFESLVQLNKFSYGILFTKSVANLKNQLSTLLPKVKEDGQLWVAFPTEGSSYETDIHSNYTWQTLRNNCFEIVDEKQINKNWKAKRFRKLEYTKWKDLSRIA